MSYELEILPPVPLSPYPTNAQLITYSKNSTNV